MSNKLRERLEAAEPAVPSVPAGSAASIFDQIRALRPQLVTATKGTGVDPDRFLRVALTELRRNPRLLNAEPASILGGLMLAAQLGLELGSTLGHCWLVPHRNTRNRTTEAVFVLGYRGIISLARRSGEIESIEARCVHKLDRFRVRYGIADRLEHEPSLAAHPGPVIAVYALARYRGGGHTFIVLTPAEIDTYRRRSKTGKEGPWNTDWEAMAAKTAVRRLAAYLPLTVEAVQAATLDEAVITDVDPQTGELTMSDTPNRTDLDETQSDTPDQPDTDTPDTDDEPDTDEPDTEGPARVNRPEPDTQPER